jgi:cytochrome P450
LENAHRDILRRAFSKGRLAALEPLLRGWIGEYVDRFVARGRADLVLDYMWEIPALAAIWLLGVPEQDVDRVKRMSVRRADFNFGRPSEAEQVELAANLAEFWTWSVQHIDRLWEQPEENFFSEMIALAKDPAYAEVLDRVYIYRMCLNLFTAGHETTTNGAGNAFLALLTHREQWERLVADPSLIPNAVDETLRFLSAAPLWRRRTTTDTVVGGVMIPADSAVLVAFGSANRDEEHFPRADRLDVARENAREHYTFGWGRHKCLGQHLARLEIRLALEELVRRLPHLRLVSGQRFTYPRNILFRGPEHVYVEWDPHANPLAADRPR